jgi:hypothetical protein
LDGNDTLLKDRHRHSAANQGLTRFAHECAKRIVCVSDAANAVSTYDDVAVRLQQTARTLLRLAQLPDAIGKLFIARLHCAHCCRARAALQEHHFDQCADDQCADDDIIEIMAWSPEVHGGQKTGRDDDRPYNEPLGPTA